MSTRQVQIRVTWERGDGVLGQELAATWCSLGVTVNGRSVTLVQETRNDALRRDIRTSAYPLALWIAEHWWALTEHLRAAAATTESLSWTAALRPEWLGAHNLRGAGDGMAWPDLAIIPEGATSRLTWFDSSGLADQPIGFLTSGSFVVPTHDLRAELTTFVEFTIERLDQLGVGETPLHKEWAALADLDEDERQFARSCARLGLDPFDVSDELADQVLAVEKELDPELVEDFLDSADPGHLDAATAWARSAGQRIRPADPVELRTVRRPVDDRRPWAAGYEAARALRDLLDLGPTERIDLDRLVGVGHVPGPAGGVRGLAGTVSGGVGVVLPEQDGGSFGVRFAQARALGLAALSGRSRALLDPSHRPLPRASRAFAAELVAPAEGIEEYLRIAPEVGERTFELVADHFATNPKLIEHQYENQLLARRP